MRYAFAVALMSGVLATVTGCTPPPPAPQPPAPAPTMLSAAEVQGYQEAIRQWYPDAVVGQVVRVSTAERWAAIDVGTSAKVGADRNVLFFKTSPLAGCGSGKVFAAFENQTYVNLAAPPDGQTAPVQIGDVAAVLLK